MKSVFKFSLIAAITLSSALCAQSGIVEVKAPEAPKPIGAYSQAVEAGPFLFLAGQAAQDPATGKLVGKTIEEQTNQVINNVEAVLRAKGLTLKDVVKVEVSLKNINDFKSYNAVYAERFSHPVKPARQTIQAAGLPLDTMILMTCTAYMPGSKAAGSNQ